MDVKQRVLCMPEILIITFHFLHNDYLNPPHYAVSSAQDTLRSFPSNATAVCLLWRAVVTNMASFWTRLVLSINAEVPATTLLVRKHLRLSKQLPIAITIKRTDEAKQDAEERRKVHAILEALRPSLHRCSSISIHTIHGSSLPTISSDLQDVSSLLQTLILQCRQDDGRPNTPFPPNAPTQLPPEVEPSTIFLTGHTIVDCLGFNRGLLTNPKTVQIKISNLCSLNYGEGEINSLLPALLDTLAATRNSHCEETEWSSRRYSLECLTLPNCIIPEGQPLQAISEGMSLSLRKLDSWALDAITQVLDLDGAHVEISLCNVDGVAFSGCPDTLWGTHLSGDLTALLDGWMGSEIILRGCPGLNDDILRLLGPTTALDGLMVLKLINCPNFTLKGLCRLVEEYSPTLGKTGPRSLRELAIVDRRRLCPEMAGLLRTSVHHFVWSTVQAWGEYFYKSQ